MIMRVMSGVQDGMFAVTNLLKLLGEYKRLLILPAIAVLYRQMQQAYEKTASVHVQTVTPLTQAQLQALTKQLQQRFNKHITITETLNPALIGGLIMQVDDLVIDSSVRGKLQKLKACLSAP